MRRFEPGNDRAELHYEDLLAAGEWTGARVGQRREGQLEFLVIIILARSEEGLKLWQWRGGERKETKNIKMHKREGVPWVGFTSILYLGGWKSYPSCKIPLKYWLLRGLLPPAPSSGGHLPLHLSLNGPFVATSLSFP